ncbi:MAG TPA: hypothetical protein VFG35_18215 [Actinoplanes sp.]|nr:hypothetical protein [Actinoplanes sp.]
MTAPPHPAPVAPKGHIHAVLSDAVVLNKPFTRDELLDAVHQTIATVAR